MEGKASLKPIYLTAKLQRIRTALGLSQNEIITQMGLGDLLTRSRISEYEAGYGPPLLVLLRYARLANITVEVLIDDELDLPATLPSPKKHEGLPRRRSNRPRQPTS